MRRILARATVVVGMGTICVAQTTTPPKTWADIVTIRGDLRYRYETREDDSEKDDKGKLGFTRELHRIRARLGAEAKCNDRVRVGIQFSTGQSDPISGNQTIGDGFDRKDMKLNLAWLDYSFLGESRNELRAVAGKMKNPFITHPDDLVWDSDLNPEGLALQGQLRAGMVTLLGNAGYFWVQERSKSDDTMLYAGQGAAKFTFMPEVSLTLGGSMYTYDNIEGFDVIDWEGRNKSYGNSTKAGSVSGSITNRAWKTGFNTYVLFAQMDLWLMQRPISLFAQQLTNTDADNFDEGFMYGITVGKAKNPKTWEIGYSHAKLEKDATPGMFTDSDRWGGGTDGQGHKLYGKYQIMKNLQFGVTYFANERRISDPLKKTDYERLQVDLSASF